MNTFDIHDFLETYNKVDGKGLCKRCLKNVPWSRDKVAAHKRVNCHNATSEERLLFAKRKIPVVLSQNRSLVGSLGK